MAAPSIEILHHHFPKSIQRIKHLIIKNPTQPKILPNKPNQQFNFNGSLDVTKKWKVGFNSGYDFTTRNISYTSFNVYRDLRCWEAKIDWVPFGFNKRYTIGINLKTASLRDVRIPRQRSWFDNL